MKMLCFLNFKHLSCSNTQFFFETRAQFCKHLYLMVFGRTERRSTAQYEGALVTLVDKGDLVTFVDIMSAKIIFPSMGEML